ncbi:hypothetical protein BDD12DRAFT_827103 [Trichophaea hybrida]|nr:hypothetical protein BDD12DRAFT_827103 [Trichophaea hybrida]
MQIHHIIFAIVAPALLATAAPVEERACADKSKDCAAAVALCSNIIFMPIMRQNCPKTCRFC